MEANSHTKECIECIRKVLSFPNFAPNCSSDSELCEILSDGETLCFILSELSDGRICYDGLTYSVNSAMLASKNLKYFLKQCRDVFGLEEQDLFEPDDLLTMRNPERVVKCVLKLLSVIKTRKEPEPLRRSSSSSSLLMNLVKEICDHEQALVDKLAKLLMYRNSLLGLLSEWSEDLVHDVFKFTERLYGLHKEMCDRLTSLAEQGCEQFCLQLGTLFGDILPKLEIYIQFFATLPTVNLQMETEFQRSPELRNQLCMLDRHFNGLGFRGLYESPIRQTTNYLQLFKRLHKAIKEERMSEASKSVEKVLHDLDALLDRANNFKRQAEQLTATKMVLAQVIDLPPELTSPEDVGLHLADDCFRVRVTDRKIDVPHGLCILTTKQLIVASMESKKDSQGTFAFNIPIVSSLQVRKCERVGALKIVLDNGKKVSLEDGKPKSKCLDKWNKMVTDVRAANFPMGWNANGHNFELRSFQSGTECSRCCQPLTGATMQGYSCSHCEKQLHVHCFQQRIRQTASKFCHKSLERGGAKKLLENREPGTFLIRFSSKGGKALSVRSPQSVEHIIILEKNGRYELERTPCSFDDLDQLLDFYWLNKMSIHFSSIDCALSDGIEIDGVNLGKKQQPSISGLVLFSET